MAAPTIDDLVKTLLDLYTGVEQRLARDIAVSLKAGIDSPDWAQQKLAQLGALRQRTERILARLATMSDDHARQAIALAAQRGGQQALRELHIQADAPLPDLPGVFDALPGVGALIRLARELALTLRSTHTQILRWTLDSYREVVARAALPEVLLGVQTRRQAAQHAWQGLVDRGITGFVDKAGRRWELASYVEMAVRTGAHQAMRQGHMDRLTDAGEDLVIVSDSPRECGLCRPWERKILSLSGRAGRVLVEDELVDDRIIAVNAIPIQVARAAGLFHPNAILGDQDCRVLGKVENAVRAWYEGPSVHLTTARGNHLTVSPNHPVLTTQGWFAADRIHEGMHVFSAAAREREDLATHPVEDLHDVPTSIEKVFDAVATHGRRTSITATSHDFHGDGRSYKGEIDVVWAESSLLHVLQADLIEELGEGGLMGPSVELHTLSRGGAHLLGGAGVSGAVGGSLPDGHAVLLQSSEERFPAGAELPGEVLARLSCEVTPDEVVLVERDWYRGHAYDLQTSTRAYLTAHIVVHNCTHSTSLYLPGVTKVDNAEHDPDGYEAKQRQRAIERHIRKWKKRSIAAIDPVAKRRADVKVREWQAALRQHIDQHGLKRLRYREQVGAGNIPPAVPARAAAPPPTPAPTPAPAPRPAPTPSRRLTPDQARAMQQRMLDGQPWTDEQRDAIERYASGWAPDINRPLRTGKKPSSLAAAKAIRDLQAAMRPLAQPVRAFRYVLPDAFGPGVRASDLAGMVGKTLQDRGFMSTSIALDGHPDEGLARAARVLPVRIELDVPAGHPAAYIEELSANPGQWELLLGAGTKLQIVEVHQDGAQTVVRVRVVP